MTSRRWRTGSGSVTGSRRSRGGRHAGWGTHNRIVPLGGAYLEIIGVADENEALRDPMGRWLLANTATGDPLMAWCCETGDIERVARKLGIALERGGRDRPDGSRLSWRVAGRDAALRRSALLHRLGRPVDAARTAQRRRTPSRCAASARSRSACAADQLEGWVDADVPVRRVDGDGLLRAIVIATNNGDIRLTGDS